jgi:hypothetical protein
MKQRIWQAGLIALATMTLAACGGSSAPSASPEAAQTMSNALSVKAATAGTVDPSEGTKTGTYIVRMAEEPATAYKGGIAGFAATKPSKGQKIDPDSAAVTNCTAHDSRRLRGAIPGALFLGRGLALRGTYR